MTKEEVRKYWDQKLLETLEDPSPLFKSTYPVTWRQRLHNKYIDLIDNIYQKLTGRWPYEE